ncbi:MAG: ThiF family adenylyltransferase [Planctomycetes bacterium]|nr:ThiF family adenylyltransferase [Planctomycetota bacterium]
MSRYSRQELFSPIGPEGQQRIRDSRVLLVGCGALGTHLAEFCVRSGVGALTIVDRDIVEASNLQRQSLFTENDVAQVLPKAEAARRHLVGVNSDVAIHAEVADFNFRNAEKLAKGATLILDASDNFETRFLINDVAVKSGTPWVYAGCVASRAVCMPVLPGKTACLTCLLEDQPATGGETCDTTGIIMPAVLQAVAWSSVVALKILAGKTDALFCKMLSVDLWTGERSAMDASTPRNGCPTCGTHNYDWLEGKRATKHAVLCGRDSVQIEASGEFDFSAARERIAAGNKLSVENDFLLRASSEGLTITLYKTGRALVHGTNNVGRAKALYARLIG